jgi:uncharacterized protein YqjF (DUF2071 family)
MCQLPLARFLLSWRCIMDRIAGTRRPSGRAVGYQDWRSLLFLHWPVPVEALRPLLPAPLSIDLYEGTAYVGLIPFAVERARPALVPARLGLDFLETNVRTYVHVGGCDPGVYFFTLDAASRLAVIGARLSLGLPYVRARMAMRRRDGVVEYGMQRLSRGRPRLAVRYTVGEHLGASRPGTLEHFLIERYLLHVRRGPSLWTVRVHHQPYPVQRAEVLDLRDELLAADGLPAPVGPPPLAHYAAGVDVEVFAPTIRRG